MKEIPFGRPMLGAEEREAVGRSPEPDAGGAEWPMPLPTPLPRRAISKPPNVVRAHVEAIADTVRQAATADRDALATKADLSRTLWMQTGAIV